MITQLPWKINSEQGIKFAKFLQGDVHQLHEPVSPKPVKMGKTCSSGQCKSNQKHQPDKKFALFVQPQGNFLKVIYLPLHMFSSR